MEDIKHDIEKELKLLEKELECFETEIKKIRIENNEFEESINGYIREKHKTSNQLNPGTYFKFILFT